MEKIRDLLESTLKKTVLTAAIIAVFAGAIPVSANQLLGYLSHPYDPTVTVSLSGGTVAGSGISVDVFIGATGTPVAGVLNFSANVVPGAGAEYGGGDATSYVQPVTDVVFSIIGVGTGVNLLDRPIDNGPHRVSR